MEKALPPADINRLRNILGAAKKVMNKVETGDYETGNIDARALTEDTVGQLVNSKPSATKNVTDPSLMYRNIENSRLPEAIKKAMLENPIANPGTPYHTFTLADIGYSEADEKPSGIPSTPKTNKVISETNYKQPSIGLGEERVKEIIQEEMMGFFTKFFAKTIQEDTKKRVIQQLIKEGKIKIKN